jgi:hypothetical protein
MQQVAQGLASLGRGKDTQLVHMTPGEVKGLQSLAMAHGGSLTINPKTGLPEAGFLEDVMPMILTTVATIYGGPAAGAATNAAITYRKTGDIQKSILNAGITYGIGQFAQGAETMGANAGPQLAQTAGEEASKNVLTTAAQTGAEVLPTENWMSNPYGTEGVQRMQSLGLSPEQITQSAADVNFQDPYTGSQNPFTRPTDFNTNPFSKEAIDYQRSRGMPVENIAQNAREAAGNSMPVRSSFENTVAGVKQMGSKEGLKDIYNRMDKYALMGLGAGAASLMQPKPKAFTPPAQTPNRYANYKYTPMKWNPATGRYENGRYGDVDYSTTQRNAAGGQIQDQSMPIDLSQNYPGSDITKSSYATLPSTRPQEILDGYGPKINPFTGAEGMAAGGLSYNADRQAYSQDNEEDDRQERIKQYLQSQGKYKGGNPDASNMPTGMETQGPSMVTNGMPPDMVNAMQHSAMPTNTMSFMAGGGSISVDSSGNRTESSYNNENWLDKLTRNIAPMKGDASGFGGALRGAVDQAKSGDAFRPAPDEYVYDPETQQYVKKTPEMKMAMGGDIRGLKMGDAIYSDASGGGPYSDAAEEGPYQGMQAQVESMSPGSVARYRKKAKAAAAKRAKLEEPESMEMAVGGMAALPEYAAGGKLLRGPGDGMSDDIPAVIKGQQPQRAALADGEFVIPADVVSHLGNGSTEAGAKRLYAMMDKVRHARTGRKAQGRQIKAEKYLPA